MKVNQEMLATYAATEFPCPIAGCDTFAFVSAAELDSHLPEHGLMRIPGAQAPAARPQAAPAPASEPAAEPARRRNKPTDRQLELVKTMIAERVGNPLVDAIRADLNGAAKTDALTFDLVSECITRLRAIRRNPTPKGTA